ncbi:2-hydroxyglutaryl-CoA dehydratase D-component [Thermincola potens JR]|uniref:2-hydroxyglutaryl-CoA dehydratase D-component n=2 Tax=Thermincola TaxID=278993 RepID=D5XD78_THEPJ|nr:2-hydroxyglutaryl-CoA dehydratase D-component [Thermincola potens JR]
MSNDWRQMWKDLGMDLEKHDEFLAPVPEVYGKLFMAQENRPKGMGYFDFVVGDIHGIRVKELVDHKANGGKVVASFCVFVPDEIITAAGGVSIGLCAGAQFPVPTGEQVLPRNLCPLIKASVGFKLDRICPYFQVADFVVGETTCDGKKKAWEILDEFIPTHVMELPQRRAEADKALWIEEIRRFKEKMEKESGVAITAEKLAASIKIANEKRAALQRLYNCRKADPAPISGKDVLLISELAFFDDPKRFTQQVNALCDELETRIVRGEGIAEKGAPRILITGSPMPIPSWKLHAIIEGSGAVVVCEETCTGTRYFETTIREDGATLDEQLAAISERALNINCACYTPNNGRIEDILRLVKEYNADGVVYYNLAFCQPYSIEYRKVEKALQEAGIPVIKIESDFSEEDTGQLQTRIEAFLEMLDK